MTTPLPSLTELLARDGWLRRLVAELVDEHEIDDVLQETWSAVLRQPATTAIERPRAWLARVARNLAMRRRRTAARVRARERAGARDERVPSTDRMLERMESQRHVAEAVKALPEPYRTAVLLRYFEDMTPAAIAAHFGVNASTVRSRLERGLGQVRHRLQRDGWNVPALAAAILAAPRRGVVMTGTGALWMAWNVKAAAMAAMLVVGGTLWLSMSAGGSADPRLPPRREGGAKTMAAASEPSPRSSASTEPVRTPLAEAAAPAAAAPPSPRHVRVVDREGQPVAGVSLVLERRDDDGVVQWSQGGVLDQGTVLGRDDLGVSDAAGVVTVPAPAHGGSLRAGPPWVTLLASGPDGATAGERDALVVVARATAITAQVAGDDGTPLEGVRIVASLDPLLDFPASLDALAPVAFPPATSEGDGRFELAGVPAVPELRLTCRHGGFVTRELRAAEVPASSRIVMQRVGAARYHVSGTVVDVRDHLIEGATVVLGEQRTTTDRYGAFTLECDELDDPSWLLAAKEGHIPALAGDVLGRLRASDPWIDGVLLRLGGAPGSMHGIVTTPTGEPVVGAVVVLLGGTVIDHATTSEDLALGRTGDFELVGTSRPSTMKVAARTAADGSFEIDGLGQHAYRLRVLDPDTLVSTTTEPFEPGAALRIFFDPRATRTVHGSVRDLAGRPVPGCQVAAALTTWPGPPELVAITSGTETAADGSFHLTMPLGDAHLDVSGDEIVGADVEVEASSTTVTPLAISVSRRCHFRVDGAGDADRFAVLDAGGKRLQMEKRRGALSWTDDSWSLDHGRSPVLSTSQAATTLVLLRDGVEVRRFPITLGGDGVQVLNPR